MVTVWLRLSKTTCTGRDPDMCEFYIRNHVTSSARPSYRSVTTQSRPCRRKRTISCLIADCTFFLYSPVSTRVSKNQVQLLAYLAAKSLDLTPGATLACFCFVRLRSHFDQHKSIEYIRTRDLRRTLGVSNALCLELIYVTHPVTYPTTLSM